MSLSIGILTERCQVKGVTIRTLVGGGAGNCLEINILVGNMGGINKWPQVWFIGA